MHRVERVVSKCWHVLSGVCVCLAAGRTTTDDELEEMLESGSPSVFTADVSAREAAAARLHVSARGPEFISISLLCLFFKDYIRFTNY